MTPRRVRGPTVTSTPSSTVNVPYSRAEITTDERKRRGGVSSHERSRLVPEEWRRGRSGTGVLHGGENTLSPMPVDGALRAELVAMLAEHREAAALAHDDPGAPRGATSRRPSSCRPHLDRARRLRGVARSPAGGRRRRAGGVDHRAGGHRGSRAAASVPRPARGGRRLRRRRSAAVRAPARPRPHVRRSPPALRLAVRGRAHRRPRAVADRRPRRGRGTTSQGRAPAVRRPRRGHARTVAATPVIDAGRRDR